MQSKMDMKRKIILIFALFIMLFGTSFSQTANLETQMPVNTDMFKEKSPALAWALAFALLVRGIGHYYLGDQSMGRTLLLTDLLLGDGLILLAVLNVVLADNNDKQGATIISILIGAGGFLVKAVVWFVDWISVLHSAYKMNTASNKISFFNWQVGKSALNIMPDVQMFNVNNSVRTTLGLNLSISL
jgi:hypothetical protein